MSKVEQRVSRKVVRNFNKNTYNESSVQSNGLVHTFNAFFACSKNKNLVLNLYEFVLIFLSLLMSIKNIYHAIRL